jgi:hypothetical protein
VGLFGNERKKLEEALDALRSELGLQSCFGGDVENHSGIAQRAAKAAAIADRMKAKGRVAELNAALDDASGAELPLAALGGGDQALAAIERLERLEGAADIDLPPIKGSGTAAQAEEARREEVVRLAAKRNEARTYWKDLLDAMRVPELSS